MSEKEISMEAGYEPEYQTLTVEQLEQELNSLTAQSDVSWTAEPPFPALCRDDLC